jgi:putative ABC transport system permease protein
MHLAFKNLFNDMTRFFLTVCGVALAVMLILLLNGFLTGLNRQATSYLNNSPGSIIVAQDGVNNLLGATSILPPGIIEKANEAAGVSKILPILSQFVILEIHDKKQPAYLIGYEPGSGGGPWEMAEGRTPITNKEIVIDSVLANSHEIQLGESLEVMGIDFTVVGFSQGTTSWMTSFFFIRKEAAETLVRIPGATSYLLVTPAEGTSIEALRQQLSDLDGVEAYEKTTVAQNDLKLFVKIFSAPLQLMVGIAFLVGTLVVGLVIYTATIERQREYGVLKAIGARNQTLYKVVIFQAMTSAIVGATLGALLVYIASRMIMSIWPQFLIVHDSLDIIWALLGGLGMALLGALVPTRLIAGLAPAEVFRK